MACMHRPMAVLCHATKQCRLTIAGRKYIYEIYRRRNSTISSASNEQQYEREREHEHEHELQWLDVNSRKRIFNSEVLQVIKRSKIPVDFSSRACFWN